MLPRVFPSTHAPELTDPNAREFALHPRCDIYSFGCLLEELPRLWMRSPNAPLPPDTPRLYGELVARCKDHNHLMRPSDMGEVYQQLEQVATRELRLSAGPP